MESWSSIVWRFKCCFYDGKLFSLVPLLRVLTSLTLYRYRSSRFAFAALNAVFTLVICVSFGASARASQWVGFRDLLAIHLPHLGW